MKKTLLLALLFVGNYGFSQGIKQDINVELLTEIISKKQDEIRDRVIYNSIQKLYFTSKKATYSTSMNLLNILLNEKNKVTMKRGIVQELSIYAITSGLERHFSTNLNNMNDSVLFSSIENVTQNNKSFGKAEKYSDKIDGKIQNETINTSSFVFDKIYYELNKNPEKYHLDKIFPNFNLNRVCFNFDSTNYPGVKNCKELISKIDDYLEKIEKQSIIVDEVKTIMNFDLTNLNFSNFKAEEINLLLNQLDYVINVLDNHLPQNNLISKYYNIILRYIIIENKENNDENPNATLSKTYTIDVEAIILELENSIFAHKTYGLDKCIIGFQPMFTIGINYSKFSNTSNRFISSSDTLNFNSLAWAGEKIGFKLVFNDKKYTRSHLPNEWYKYKGHFYRFKDVGQMNSKPLIVKSYLSFYGSGLLYNIANIKTEEKFNYPIIGSSFGVQFFNDMDMSIGYAIPIATNTKFEQTMKNGFFNVSFDIPIFEYLKAARKDK